MEDQIKQVMAFLTHEKLEVKSQAVDILQGLAADEATQDILYKFNVVKELAKLLHDDKCSHQANLTLLTLSQHERFVEQMIECKAFNTFQDIILNVMKSLTEEDLAINKQILVENKGAAPTDPNKEEKDGVAYKTLFFNTTDKLTEGEIIPVINLENCRFSVLNISNMCCYSREARNMLLEGDDAASWQANHFHTLLDWYLNNNIETLFSDYAYILTTLTADPIIRNFMSNNVNKLDDKIKKHLLHENNKIRQNTIKAIRNVCFEHDDEEFAQRFTTFDENTLHLFDLLPKTMYMCVKKAGIVKSEDLEKIEGVLGKFWVPVKTKLNENNLDISYKEELEMLIEIVLITTNIDWNKYIDYALSDKKCVEDLLMVLEVLKKYVDAQLYDKITIIIDIYYGNVMGV